MGLEELLIFAGVYVVIEIAKFVGVKSDAFPALSILVGAVIAMGIAYTGPDVANAALQAAAERGALLGLAAVGGNQFFRRLPKLPEKREREVEEVIPYLSEAQEERLRAAVMKEIRGL